VQALLALTIPLPLAAAVTFCVCGAAALYGASRLLRGNPDGALLIALGAWYALPNPYPWYALWILPVAFLNWNAPAAPALVSATLLIVLRYFGDATSDVPAPVAALIVLAEFGIPLALFSVARKNRARPDRRENHIPGPDFARLRSR
jgi:hypothetical protein